MSSSRHRSPLVQAINRRARYIANRLQRHGARINQIAFLVGISLLVLCVFMLGTFAAKTLDDEAEIAKGPEGMVEALRELQQTGLSGYYNDDIFFYQPDQNRSSVFPEVDRAHLHGQIGQVDGKPFWTPQRPFLKMTKEQKAKAHEGYCFNTKVSATLTMDRTVPEYNSQRCQKVEYDYAALPTADVVIVFHNEDLSVLLRSVHSILNKTPPKLLERIILVNDDSNLTSHPWLFDDLPRALTSLPKTELIHLTRRRGLMMARMEGTSLSQAPITVYLDSHIECTNRWLEPMLDEIQRDPKRIVTPMIHGIHADTFEFQPGAVGVVGFTWTLGQSHPTRETDHFKPLASPVMAGGLFAANREWFLELGGYDPEMKLYGGEEMEIGFKTWQCGGSVYALPCSRVGHIFRTPDFWKGQVYKVPYEEIVRNKLRTAEVWMDEYKEIAKLAMSKLPAGMGLGPLEAVMAVRERLKCKPFSWYLKNVYPDLWAPDLSNVEKGAISNPATGACVDTMQRDKGGPAGLYPCHGHHGSQAYIMDKSDGQVRSVQSSFTRCLGLETEGRTLSFGSNLCQKWQFEPVPGAPRVGITSINTSPVYVQGLMRLKKGGCLRAISHPSLALGLDESCDAADPQLLWAWGD